MVEEQPKKKLWKVSDVANYLNVAESTVYRKIEDEVIIPIVLFEGERKRTLRFDEDVIIKQFAE